MEHEEDAVVLAVPLYVAFGNPGLVQQIGLGPVLASLGGESQYANDEQMDNQLRSTLFEVPAPGSDPRLCTGRGRPAFVLPRGRRPRGARHPARP